MKLVVCKNFAQFDQWRWKNEVHPMLARPVTGWSQLLGATADEVVFLPGWEEARSEEERRLLLDQVQAVTEIHSHSAVAETM